jgi:hypothetical protein
MAASIIGFLHNRIEILGGGEGVEGNAIAIGH